MTDDAALLRAYLADRSPDAFAAIVDRYGVLVRSTARRHVDASLADDVAQATFLLLAMKADRIGADRSLAAWLLTTTRFVALNERKIRDRARRREAKLQHMRPTTSTSPDEAVDAADDLARHGPLVDEALSKLRPRERDAIVWRFIENASLESIGARQSISADTARRRIGRALAKVRDRLRRRRVHISGDVGQSIASVIGLDAKLPQAVYAPFLHSSSSASSPAAQLLAKGAAALMTANQIKLIVIGSIVALLGGGGAMTAVILLSRSSTITDPVPLRVEGPVASRPAPFDAAAAARYRETTNRVRCASDLSVIGREIESYARSHDGQLPPDFATLMRDRALDPRLFVCPSGHDTPADGPWTDDAVARADGHLSYVYVGQSLTLSTVQPDEPLAFEKMSHHHSGGNILFGDLHCEFDSMSRFRSLMQTLSGSSRLNASQKADLAQP